MGKNKKRKKEEELLFTDRQFKTAPGEDTVHPQMIKKLSPETLARNA